MERFKRRLLSITAVTTVAAALWLAAPIWVPATALIGLVRRRRFVLLRLATMAWVYATMECLGV
ncbi:MAG: hypothetical protein AAF485_32060, partial [Chloroflexota bacterium]